MLREEDYLITQQVQAIYKQLHQIPEIGLQQFRTTSFIRQYISHLEGVQIVQPEVHTSLQTGLIIRVDPINTQTEVEMANHSDGFLFRCDIDALNFKQQSGVQYASDNGLHHACGHDAHTSMMLVALKNIAANRGKIQRSIYICFQPGEEGKGGASKLLERYPSLFGNIKNCFAIHVANFKVEGEILIPSEYATANTDRFTIQVFGRSAHVMIPQQAVDANYIGCQIVNEIYTCKSRFLDPTLGLAIAVTEVKGGSENLTSISNKFKIVGSIRSYDRVYHQKVLQHIKNFAKAICELNGAEWKFEIVNKNLYRAVKNDESAIELVVKTAKRLNYKVQYLKPSFAGEDFCQFSQRKPSCYFCLRVGLQNSFKIDSGESLYPIHSNKFRLDQKSLYRGVKMWSALAQL